MADELTPRKAKTLQVIAALPRDNVGTEHHWIILDGGNVTIAAQQPGSPPTAIITIPRETFEAFADWYNTGVWRKPRKRKSG